MGTRSLTEVLDGDDILLTMYRQFDGYPTGHGKDLKEFLSPFTIVNGFSGDMKTGTHANGLGCLAAQLVAAFKDGIGNIYLYPPGTRDVWEEYVYQIYLVGDVIHLKLTVPEAYAKKGKDSVLFDGPINDFDPQAVEDSYYEEEE